MKKKLLIACSLVLCAVVLVVASVMTTLALLTSSSGVSNVFTVGDVKISMYESKVNSNGEKVNASGTPLPADGTPVKVDTNSYHLVPGETYIKDPTIYINSTENDNMYLFVKSSNMIRTAEAGNYDDRVREGNPTTDTPLTMREQMIEHGWIEFLRSGDGVEIVWVYGTRDTEGNITPTPVNKTTVQKRHGVEYTVGGEFRLCDDFTVYQHADVSLYGAASVTFTGFAIQKSGFTGDTKTGQELTKAAWEAIKGSFPYQTGIISPINPYVDPTNNTDNVGPYDAVPTAIAPHPFFEPLPGVDADDDSSSNTGDSNTGDSNTGDSNTGDANTGDGNEDN